MKKKIEPLLETLTELANDKDLRLDAMRFDEGNNTAGVRVRKKMQDIREIAVRIRDRIQLIKKRRKQDEDFGVKKI